MRLATPSLEQLEQWLVAPESEHLEFKAASRQFDVDKATRYCVALANEGGGQLVLGVSDQQPRQVVGTAAFPDLKHLEQTQGQRLRLQIEVTELIHADGRVVVLTVPSRPIGVPVHYKAEYWMRRGEELVAMSPEVLRHIFTEAQLDYSAEVCAAASMDDLDPVAIAELRRRWAEHSGNTALLQLDDTQLLNDAELISNGGLTYAALILLGTHKGLGRLLAQAETIYEYRTTEAHIAYAQRQEFRRGFLGYLDELWELINQRNDLHFIREGLFRRDLPTFNKDAVYEGLLNALAHRDYRRGGSIFVKLLPRKLQIVSPGGFPNGITAENLLWKQAPRNRRIAEVLAKCGLVERSGQGANRMVEACIRESKALPDYSRSDDYEVSLVFHGDVLDEGFLAFLEQVGAERLEGFTTDDFLALDAIHREQGLDERLRLRLPRLRELRIIGHKAHGKHLLSRRFYRHLGKAGTYTRRRGLDKETNKALLLKHMETNAPAGTPMAEFQQVLPSLKADSIRYLLKELKREQRAHKTGTTRNTLWFLGRQEAQPGSA